jgi:hypothetical protein
MGGVLRFFDESVRRLDKFVATEGLVSFPLRLPMEAD